MTTPVPPATSTEQGTHAPRAACPPDHKHADSTVCYKIHRCGCDQCRESNRTRRAAADRLRMYGRFTDDRVDVGPVREHLAYLTANRIGMRTIAETSGVARSVLQNISRGHRGGDRTHEPVARVARKTADAILAIHPNLDLVPDYTRIPARGAHRRIQALAAIGWSVTRIAHEIGWEPSNLHAVLHRDEIAAVNHRKIAAIYDRLATTAPPHDRTPDLIAYNRTRRTATQRGWEPPIAWDDIDHDPAITDHDEDFVDELAVELFVAGHDITLTRAEQIAATVHLTGLGRTQAQIADLLRIHQRQVQRFLDYARRDHEEVAS